MENNTMTDFVLNFGKFKGQKFSTTPSWYQQWLPQQPWFKMPINAKTNPSSWGIYYIPTKYGQMFANLKSELVAEFTTQNEAILAQPSFCYVDELHVGYSIKPIYK